MKGTELPINLSVIIALLILVLAVVAAFILTQSREEISEAEANKVFGFYCETYKDAGCSWRVTRAQGFSEFLNACKILHGPQNEAFTCLYQYCCPIAGDAECDGLCAICRGNKFAGLPPQTISDCIGVHRNRCESECEI